LPFRNQGLGYLGLKASPLSVAVRRDRERIRPTAGGKVTVVVINSMGQQAFHQLLPANAVPEMAVGEGVEWFTDVADTIIGNIGFDAKNKGWTLRHTDT